MFETSTRSGPCRLRGVAQTLARALLPSVVSLLLAVPGWGEDSDELRYYFDLRYEDLAGGLQKAHDGAGVSAGVNIGRYLGAEFAVDAYDVKVGDVSETEILSFVPQLRLRYPLFHDLLTPYMIAGGGLAVSQANDARAPVHWPGGKTGVHGVASLGGGVEYFIADNIALGLGGKYLFTGDVEYNTEGTDHTINVSSALVGANVRVFYPELHPDADAESARNASARFYFGVRTGTALLVDRSPFPGVHATPEQPIANTNLTPMFGAALGADIGRYAGVEISLANYELKLGTAAVNGIGEYSVFPIAVQPQVHYPLMGGRLEPYAAGGVGAEFAEINDRGTALKITAKDITVIGSFEAGIQYFLMSNVSLGCDAQYVISRGHTLQIDQGPVLSGDLDSFFLSVGLHVFLFDV